MSSLFNAIKDYVYAGGEFSDNEASSDNKVEVVERSQGHDTKDTETRPNPYSSKGAEQIIVQLPPSALAPSVPTMTLGAIQIPTINTGDSDSDRDSDNGSEIQIAVPTIATPSMTLSTAEAPDGKLPLLLTADR